MGQSTEDKTPECAEWKQFEEFARRLLAVPAEEIAEAEERYQAERKQRGKPPPLKPNPSESR